MDLQEIRKKVQDAQSRIADIIGDLEKETDVRVTSIETSRVVVFAGSFRRGIGQTKVILKVSIDETED